MKRLQLFGLRPALLVLLLGAVSLAVPATVEAARSKPASARKAKKKSKAKKKKSSRSREKPAPKPADEDPEDEALSMPSLDLEGPSEAPPPGPSKSTLKVIDVSATPAPAPSASETTVAAKLDEPAPNEGNLLDVAAGVRLFRRDLLLGDPQARASPTYSLELGPAPFLAADLFPGRGITRAIPAPLGLGVTFEHAVGISSGVIGANGAIEYPTRAHALQLELLGRFLLSRWELTARAGYGWRTFAVSDALDGTAKPRVPSVSYDHLTASGQARVRLTEQIFLTGHAGVRRVLAAGELESDGYFPGVSGFGVTAGAGLGFVLGPIETRLGVDLERYFLELDPLAAQNASASDQYLGVSLALAWRS